MDYPYYKNFYNEENILKDFKELQKYKIKKIENLMYNSILSFEINYTTDLHLIKITDWFSEASRIKCSFNNYITPLEYYTKHKSLFEHFESDYAKIDEKLSEIKSCNNFPVTIVINVLNYFKPKKVLDFSSGWGDRLIGTLAYGAEYTGVDPSNSMEKHYKDIVSVLGGTGKVYKKGFENFKVKKNHYDLVFTSPPFFDLEIYEKSSTQSVEKYKTIQSWKKNFLFPSLSKSLDSLKIGKHMAIYVSDYRNIKYTQDMKNYVKELGNNEYLGTINWVNKDGSSRVRSIYVWKKIK